MVTAAPRCERRAPLTNLADSLICRSHTTYKLLNSYISTLYLGLKGLDVTLTLVIRSTL